MTQTRGTSICAVCRERKQRSGEPDPLAKPKASKAEEAEPLAFQFHGAAYSLPLIIAFVDPEARQVVLRDFKLAGNLSEQKASFVLTANAHIGNPRAVRSLSSPVSSPSPNYRRIPTGASSLTPAASRCSSTSPATSRSSSNSTPRCGRTTAGTRSTSASRPVPCSRSFCKASLPTPSLISPAAARPERTGNDFTSYLPPDGTVKLSWKTAVPEVEGKLFYSAEMLTQVSVGPGLMEQSALLDGKVMQGALEQVTLLLGGTGEITRVQGEQVVAWHVEPGANAGERRLVVQFNQPQKEPVLPQHSDADADRGISPNGRRHATPARKCDPFRRLFPHREFRSGAARSRPGARALADFARAVSGKRRNEGRLPRRRSPAVCLSLFLARISPCASRLIKSSRKSPSRKSSVTISAKTSKASTAKSNSIFAKRRSANCSSASPKGYAVARLVVAGLSDYFLRDVDDGAELRLVYAQPVSDRQLVQFRLERNQPLAAAEWELPRIEVEKAKSVRGNIAISADVGFRLNAERTQGLTEMATAFFPRKVPGIQSAFRVSEPSWQAKLHIERLPQSIHVDALHLFSISEGVAYGSSVLNYIISGSPVAAFRVELSDEYFNVEFTGKDIRSWEKADGGYVVQLHTPVTGPYTLLATYERPFKAQGETLAFTGARPLDVQEEQGHTVVTSAYQFQVKPVDVSAGLLPLEPGEVPPEYRLFFDAPILAAYHYTARPFNLKLALSPLAQGDSLSQVVDRASLTTNISKQGQAVTDVRYFVKNRGHAHFRVTLPEGAELWSATVDNTAVVPVKDGNTDLIPMAQQADPNAVLAVDLKFATQTEDPRRLKVATPVVGAPVMLAEWKLEPDTAQRLVYYGGSLTPVGGPLDQSGFGQFVRLFADGDSGQAIYHLVTALVLLAVAAFIWRRAERDDIAKNSGRRWFALAIGGAAFALASVAFLNLGAIASRQSVELPRNLTFLAPVQQAGDGLDVVVDNLEEKTSALGSIADAWPAILALAAFAYARMARQPWATIIGWTVLAWTALRCPNGAAALLIVLEAYFIFHLAVPAVRRLWRTPRLAKTAPSPGGGAAAATAAVLFALLVHGASAAESPALPAKEAPIAETVTQQIRIEENFAFATAKIHGQATKDQRLPLLFDSAVLTKITYPNEALRLVSTTSGVKHSQQLLALQTGAFDIELHYQVPVAAKDDGTETGFVTPCPLRSNQSGQSHAGQPRRGRRRPQGRFHRPEDRR